MRPLRVREAMHGQGNDVADEVESAWKKYRRRLKDDVWWATAERGALLVYKVGQNGARASVRRFSRGRLEEVVQFLEERVALGLRPIFERHSNLDFEDSAFGDMASDAFRTMKERLVEREGLLIKSNRRR